MFKHTTCIHSNNEFCVRVRVEYFFVVNGLFNMQYYLIFEVVKKFHKNK